MKIKNSWLKLTKKSPEAWGWLFHYLLASGKELRLPKKCRIEAEQALISALYNNSWSENGDIHVSDSRYYEGVGFLNKPTLFYLVGGFTAKLKIESIGYYYYSIEDVYDWHPDANRNWAWSSTPFPKFFGKILSKFFPDLFSAGDTCMAVSNKLWSLVGKPFVTKGCIRLSKEVVSNIMEDISQYDDIE